MRKHVVTLLVGWVASAAVSAGAQEPLLAEKREAAKAAPKDAAAQRAFGRALLRAGRLSEAEAQMAQVVRLEGGSIEAMYELARVKFAGGDYKASRAYCKELEKKNPNHVWSHVCMARAALVWRRAALASEPLGRALAAGPDDFEVRLALGDERAVARDYPGAQDAYARASALRTSSAEPHLGLGRLHLAFGKTDEARVALRQALALDPEDPEIQLELGRIEGGKSAVELLERALAGRPGWPEASRALATARIAAGNAAEAEPVLRAYLAKEPGDPVATAQLGVALVKVGKLDEAQQVLTRALELRPNDHDAAFALGELHEKAGRNEEAIAQYRKTADIRQQDPSALIAAARLSLRLSRALLAEALVEKALARAPRSAAALALQGDILHGRGERARAREVYQQALAGEGPLDRAHVQARLREK